MSCIMQKHQITKHQTLRRKKCSDTQIHIKPDANKSENRYHTE
ncbi:hypothetical protein KUCAC02_011880 [Chaenocephalus aceratus]|uniref:Uncharacterized protein n=1 Tax=Chaenocephalus aceratus TaxID=36190 RepID=A0ACB9XAN8_CHAAC|nr:hypothetical protein KUCAC02_011880 [Chaenocephalus aceratus]